MRDLAFRIWDKNKNEWIKNGCGEPIDGKLYSTICLSEYIVWPLDYEIQQYTGLDDKNGRGIYEGDIMLIGYNTPTTKKYKAEVIFNHGAFRLDKLEMQMYSATEIEVIGNIFENPELIK